MTLVRGHESMAEQLGQNCGGAASTTVRSRSSPGPATWSRLGW